MYDNWNYIFVNTPNDINMMVSETSKNVIGAYIKTRNICIQIWQKTKSWSTSNNLKCSLMVVSYECNAKSSSMSYHSYTSHSVKENKILAVDVSGYKLNTCISNEG